MKLSRFSSLSNLLSYLDTLTNSKVNIFSPLTDLINQKGQTCKIVALANVLRFYFNANITTTKPVPIYKHYRDNYPVQDLRPLPTLTMRQLAKKYAGSSVGEIYTQSMFKKLVHALGEKTNDKALENAEVEIEHYYTSKNLDAHADYIARIKNLVLENKTPPIVFFDVDEYGDPRVDGDGSRQHAAIVLGCIETPDTQEIEFVVGHWGEFYIFDAHDLALSADRLKDHCPQESFFKFKMIDNQGFQTAFWHEFHEDQPQLFDDDLSQFPKSDYPSFDQLKNLEENKTLISTHAFPENSYSLTLFLTRKKGNPNTENDEGFRSGICLVKPDLSTQKEEKQDDETLGLSSLKL